jgi:inner membrane protein
MASLFGHAAVALTLGRVSRPAGRVGARLWICLAVCSILPDLDVVMFAFGVPYQSQWGHRGFTHSLAFAAVSALVFTILSRGGVGRYLVMLVVAASHPVLDALTNGGLGVALYWPFRSTRYFFSYRPIEVSPIGLSGFLSQRGLEVLWSETLILFLPCLLALGLHWAWRARRVR